MDIDLLNITDSNFEELALKVFKHQASNIPIYKDYVEHLGLNVSDVNSIEEIPFLPINFFKTHQVFDPSKEAEVIFTSSGTTGQQTSKHYVAQLKHYQFIFEHIFDQFYGDIEGYTILALLPSYLEREGSSLIYMTQELINKSKKTQSGFYLHNLEELASTLVELDAKGEKTILLGVSYALLDLIEAYSFKLIHTIVIETGGMKGQRKEMIKEEFYQKLKQGFGLTSIQSEYGMTELLSQAYSKDEGKYACPKWMKAQIRDTNDPFCLIENGKTGGLNIIDLANKDSCSFIATQDLARINPDGTFSILGRFDNSDIRGCNLMIG